MLVFPTIRHTGSHFVVGLFGLDITQAKSWKHAGEGDFYFDHIHPAFKDKILAVLKDKTIVVPLRHPKVTAVSWRARQKPESDMIAAFDFLVDYIDPFKPYYLPLDSVRRDDYLTKLNVSLGLNLTTDWQPTGVKQNNAALRHEQIQASPRVMALCERIEPFLAPFYGSK